MEKQKNFKLVLILKDNRSIEFKFDNIGDVMGFLNEHIDKWRYTLCSKEGYYCQKVEYELYNNYEILGSSFDIDKMKRTLEEEKNQRIEKEDDGNEIIHAYLWVPKEYGGFLEDCCFEEYGIKYFEG